MQNRAQKAAFDLVAQLAIGGASREEALRKFGLLGEHAVPALSDALNLSERPIVLLAAQALALIKSRKVIAPLLNVADQRRDRDPELVTFALRGVAANLVPDDTDRVLPFALELRAHPDPFVRAAVAAVLGALDPDRTNEALAELAKDPDRFVAETAASMTRFTGAGGDDLLTRLADARGEIRLAAVESLLGREDCDDILVAHLDTSLPKLRRTLLEAAARRRSPSLSARLLHMVEAPETSDHDRALCLRGVVNADDVDLGTLGRTAHRFSQVSDVFVRAEAFAAGIRCGVPHADELIDRALRDPVEHVQEVAAKAHAERAAASHGSLDTPGNKANPTPAATAQPEQAETGLAETGPARPEQAETGPADPEQAQPPEPSRSEQHSGDSFVALAERESRVRIGPHDTVPALAPSPELTAPSLGAGKGATDDEAAETADEAPALKADDAPASGDGTTLSDTANDSPRAT